MMDKLLFRDNQFFGVNHEEGACAGVRFQDIRRSDKAASSTPRTARHPHLHVHHPTGSPGVRPRPGPAKSLRNGSRSSVHAVRPEMRERRHRTGMLGRTSVPPRGGSSTPRSGRTLGGHQRDIEGIATLLIDAGWRCSGDCGRSSGCRTSSSTCSWAWASTRRSGSSPTTCVTATRRPGFITMNLPALLDVLERQGIDNPIVCANINKIGFRMSGGMDAYKDALQNRRCRVVAHVGCSPRAPSPAGRSSGSTAAQHHSVVFGRRRRRTSATHAAGRRVHPRRSGLWADRPRCRRRQFHDRGEQVGDLRR